MTVDLPTPPLPDETPMTRVLASGRGRAASALLGRARARRGRARRRSRGFGVDTEHAGAQALAQPAALLVAHHDEVQLDLFDAGHREGDAVDLLGQSVGARPGRDRQRDFEEGPSPLRSHRAHEAELTERQVELGIDDRAQRGLELGLVNCCHALPRLGWDLGPGAARARGTKPASPQLEGLVPR